MRKDLRVYGGAAFALGLNAVEAILLKILVTGAAGFIGSTLCETLLGRGDVVVGMDDFNDYYSPARKRANVSGMVGNPNFTMEENDFADREPTLDLVEKHRPDVIAHLGALGSVRFSVKAPHKYIRVNIEGTANLLEAARETGVGHFVFASTSSVYGQTESIPFVETDSTDRPLAPYPASKKSGEVLGHAFHNMHGLNFTALRFFNVYGPRGRPDMMPYIVLESLLNDREITLFDGGKMRRDWTYVDDIISGVVAAIDNPMGYEIFNIGRGQPVWMTDFVEMLEGLIGKKVRSNVVDAPASEPKVTFANVDKAREKLGYNPQTSVGEGLERFWKWYQENG